MTDYTNRDEVMNPPESAAEGSEARNLNTSQRHGTGAVPQGMEAQATQPSAAPNVVCAGCGEPTTIYAPLCKECARNYVEIVGEIPTCALCDSMGWPIHAPILPADKLGIHYTMTGGYAGKCSAASISEKP